MLFRSRQNQLFFLNFCSNLQCSDSILFFVAYDAWQSVRLIQRAVWHCTYAACCGIVFNQFNIKYFLSSGKKKKNLIIIATAFPLKSAETYELFKKNLGLDFTNVNEFQAAGQYKTNRKTLLPNIAVQYGFFLFFTYIFGSSYS